MSDLPPKSVNVEGEDPGGPKICGAKTRSGGICTQFGMPNGRCKHHGGKSLSGINAPSFKTGRYSKALKRLAEDIGERASDPDLVDPRRSIAVQESVVARLYEMADDGDGPSFREEVRTRLKEAILALKDNPADGVALLGKLQGYVGRGAERTRALMGVAQGAESWNRSQERFWKTAMASARAISPDEFMTMMFRLTDIIEHETGDPDVAKRILARTDKELCGGAMGLGG